jgi:hypothetical protein
MQDVLDENGQVIWEDKKGWGGALARSTSNTTQASLRGLGNVANGTILHDIEGKATRAYKLVTESSSNSDKLLFAEIKARNDEEVERALIMSGLGPLVNNATSAKHRNKTRTQAWNEHENGEAEEDIQENIAKEKDRVIEEKGRDSKKVIGRNLRGLKETHGGKAGTKQDRVKSYAGDELFRTIFKTALEEGDDATLGAIASDPEMVEAARFLVANRQVSDKAIDNANDRYFAFLDDTTANSKITAALATQDPKLNDVNLLDERTQGMYRQQVVGNQHYEQFNSRINKSLQIAKQNAANVFSGKKTPTRVAEIENTEFIEDVNNYTNDTTNIKSDTNFAENIDNNFDNTYNINVTDDAQKAKNIDNIRKNLLGEQPDGTYDVKAIPLEFHDFLKQTGFLSEDGLTVNAEKANAAVDQTGLFLEQLKKVRGAEKYKKSADNYKDGVTKLNLDDLRSELKAGGLTNKYENNFEKIGFYEREQEFIKQAKKEMRGEAKISNPTIRDIITREFFAGMAGIIETNDRSPAGIGLRATDTSKIAQAIAKKFKDAGKITDETALTTYLIKLGTSIYSTSGNMNIQFVEDGRETATNLASGNSTKLSLKADADARVKALVAKIIKEGRA